jgi:hypothetical protein
MINSREYRIFKFRELKSVLTKRYPGCKTIATNGGFAVQSESGKSLIPHKYPSLQSAKDVFTAWKNLFVVDHWEKIEKRNNRGFAADINNSTAADPNAITREPYEYFIENNNIKKEESYD